MRYLFALLLLGLAACDGAGARNTGPTAIINCLQDSTTGSKSATASNGDVSQVCDKHSDNHAVVGVPTETP